MLSRKLNVTEPHPSVPKSGGYLYGGRGGAGNFRKYKSEELTKGPEATGPASLVSLQRPNQRTVAAGRGGAGNMFSQTEARIFQFDEEMIKDRRETATPIYRVGRGGAGNLFSDSVPLSRKGSTDSAASTTSSERASINRRNSGGVLSIFSRRSS